MSPTLSNPSPPTSKIALKYPQSEVKKQSSLVEIFENSRKSLPLLSFHPQPFSHQERTFCLVGQKIRNTREIFYKPYLEYRDIYPSPQVNNSHMAHIHYYPLLYTDLSFFPKRKSVKHKRPGFPPFNST